MFRNRSTRTVTAIVLGTALLMAGCGGSDDDDATGTTDAVEETAPDGSAEPPADATSTTEPTTEGTSTDDGGSAGPATGEPIKVGAIVTASGGPTFAPSTDAAAAFFEQLNERGGINGRPVEYIVIDDAFDGTKTAQAARQLLDQDGVVALVGSASIADCPINGPEYTDAGIVSIGLGIAPQCFTSPNIAPVNTGLFQGTGVSLVYAVDDLGKTSPCTLLGAANGAEEAVQPTLAAFTAQTGVELVSEQYYPDGETDFGPFLLNAQSAGCDVLVAVVAGADVIAVEKQATELGVRESMEILQLSSAYNAFVAEALGGEADGMVANSEFLPYTGSGADDPGLAEYFATMEAGGVGLDSFGQGGFLSAKIFTDVVSAIDGEITRESVTEAFKSMEPYETPLLGTPYVFGPGDAHQPNTSSRFVELRDGDWVPLTDEWTTLSLG